jgi:thioredoxin 1
METFGSIIGGEQPVLVDFHATWCGPCKAMDPEIKQFAHSNKEVRVLKIDVDKNPHVASQYNVMGVPTLILFRRGTILWRQSGAMNARQLADTIKSKL